MPKILVDQDGRVLLYQGSLAIEGCEPECCGEQVGACCLPDGACIETTASDCASLNGAFYPGASCDDGVCPGGTVCETYLRARHPGTQPARCGPDEPTGPVTVYLCAERTRCSDGTQLTIGQWFEFLGLCFVVEAEVPRDQVSGYIIVAPVVECFASEDACESEAGLYLQTEPCLCTPDPPQDVWICYALVWEQILRDGLCPIYEDTQPDGRYCIHPNGIVGDPPPGAVVIDFGPLYGHESCCQCCDEIWVYTRTRYEIDCWSEGWRRIPCGCTQDEAIFNAPTCDELLEGVRNCCCEMWTMTGYGTGVSIFDGHLGKTQYDLVSAQLIAKEWHWTVRRRDWDSNGVLYNDETTSGVNGISGRYCSAPDADDISPDFVGHFECTDNVWTNTKYFLRQACLRSIVDIEGASNSGTTRRKYFSSVVMIPGANNPLCRDPSCIDGVTDRLIRLGGNPGTGGLRDNPIQILKGAGILP